jgi:murein DD-endopeptidase MepM/ murein hydrolase activator NlpD
MSKAKYKYNPKTLTYEKAELSFFGKVLKFFSYIGTGLVFAVVFIALFFMLFDSPKEKRLKRENEQLKLQYSILNKRIEQLDKVLANIEQRDDNIYRVIFEAEPIPDNIREAGFGGANRYENLEGFNNSDLVIETTKRLDKLAKQMYIQSKSLDDVYKMAREKERLLASIPAIMPVANENLTHVASGYGMRFHPILKIRLMHTGMDFTAPTGTEVHVTGDGIVEEVSYNGGGYGKHIVVDHGYGYKTLYAHLNDYNIRVGQKVKRGDIIGFVGNTGRSTGPHLHYEVIKDGKKVNPVNYYSNDLTPNEYDRMIEISSKTNQSFD